MCGIVAIFSPHGGLVRHDVTAAMATLRPRGPDGEGVWVSPGRRAVLGHARLAVIDLRTGGQPIGDAEGRVYLVANGEFYGYREIRRELLGSGCRLRTESDSEIALHLYLRHGVGMLRQLRGEFAFVLWDERRGVLLAARDRFGIKPLYYAWHAGRLHVASTISALLAEGVPARWDTEAFAAHLQLGLPPDRTLFAGVQQLPAGCFLVGDGAGSTVRRYWDLDLPYAEEVLSTTRMDLAEHVDAIRAAAQEAVRLRTVADVSVACHLSGGLDSSAVAAMAATHAPVTAFTVGFDDPALDESPVAIRTARRLGFTHHVLDGERSDLATGLRETVRAGEMLQENSHGIARLRQSAAIRRHGFKVVLSGDGGDETFLGYPQLRRDLAYSMSPDLMAGAHRGYRKLAAAGMSTYLNSLLTALGFLPSWVVERHLTVTQPIKELLRPEFAAELAAADSGATVLADAGPQLTGRSPVHRSLYLFARTWLPNYILAAERLDSANAIEVRAPLFDHRLFEVAKSTPLAWYAAQGTSKYLLRAVMRDRLPAEVLNGDKRGFFAPAVVSDDRALTELRELATALRESPFFDHRAVQRLINRLAAGPPAHRTGSERILQLAVGSGVLAEEHGLTAGRSSAMGGGHVAG